MLNNKMKSESLCLRLTLSHPVVELQTHLALVQNLFEMSVREPHSQSTPRGRPNPQAHHMKQWPGEGMCFRCCMCTAKHKQVPNSSASNAKSACPYSCVLKFITQK